MNMYHLHLFTVTYGKATDAQKEQMQNCQSASDSLKATHVIVKRQMLETRVQY